VMYAGQVVEQAETFELFRNPRHPYTLGLLKAIPSLDGEEDRLYNIRGSVPDLADLPKGCRFCPRCDCAGEDCGTDTPALVEISPGHMVRCIRRDPE
ncbi:MAG: ABC transporter ATP-binding protein, partial [Ruminiclostridium sp.]|nr:ABC transporter ATP-binding protein [Ruminiclostridium sp.]